MELSRFSQVWFLLAAASLFSFPGCGELKSKLGLGSGGSGGSSNSSTPGGGGSGSSQSDSQLAGEGLYCATTTTLNGTYANLYELTLTSSGAFGYAVYLTDASSCATNTTSNGGNNYATYTAGGAYWVSGAAGTPSTATKITFTVLSASMVIRAGTFSGGPAAALATWLNASCGSSLGFSTGSDSSESLLGSSCAASGGYSAVVFPSGGSTFENVVYNAGSALEFGSSTGQTIWMPGGSSFPSGYAASFYNW